VGPSIHGLWSPYRKNAGCRLKLIRSQQSLDGLMYPNLDSGPGSTSPAWRIFITPGILILRWQYLFPKAGNVYGSARRLNNPTAQILFAAFFWLLVVVFVFCSAQIRMARRAGSDVTSFNGR
jgi:hypothetical protein